MFPLTPPLVRSHADRYFFFFFSSRRRHTRWNCDWSSDVCSSDLYRPCANRDNSPSGVSPTGSPQTAAVAKRLITLLRYAIRGEKDKSTYAGPSVSRQLSPFHPGNLPAKARRRLLELFLFHTAMILRQWLTHSARDSDTVRDQSLILERELHLGSTGGPARGIAHRSKGMAVKGRRAMLA